MVLSMMIDDKPRCGWMGDDELMLRYHDEEWGVPVHENRAAQKSFVQESVSQLRSAKGGRHVG